MLRRSLQTIGTLLLSLMFLIPIFWVISLSVRSKRDVFSTLFLTREMHFENYLTTWTTFHLGRLFLNSAIITGVSVLIVLMVSSMAAYAFCRLRYRGPEFFFYLILAYIAFGLPIATIV